MSALSNIEWTDSTFNPWIGCMPVGPGCDNCYPSAWAKRYGRDFADRTRTKTWADPVRWNREHDAFYQLHGRRRRVFCASLADVFDNSVDPHWRADLFSLIEATPDLDWLLLTKRIGNAAAMLPTTWANGWSNVWIGATVVNQQEADRDVPKLLALPAAMRFLSIEPMLGPIDLRRYLTPTGIQCPDVCPDTRYVLESEVGTVLAGSEVHPLCPHCGEHAGWTGYDAGIDWVVVGGESGSSARPMHPDWPRSLRDQCRIAAIPFLFKQWGEWGEFANENHYTHCGAERRPHAWVDGDTGDHGLCWVVDDDGVWSNHTGAPRTDTDGQVVASVAVVGWYGKKVSGRSLDGLLQHEFPETAPDVLRRLAALPA
ncbi:protein gp37 [Burkholderia sp. D7]|nr:protein gp37 [Burkholderia sp. D7]